MRLLGAVDPAGIAVIVTAITGAVLGGLGFLRGAKADNVAAGNAERSVARDEFDSVVAGQREMITNLRIEVERCEVDKVHQAAQIKELIVRVAELEKVV